MPNQEGSCIETPRETGWETANVQIRNFCSALLVHKKNLMLYFVLENTNLKRRKIKWGVEAICSALMSVHYGPMSNL